MTAPLDVVQRARDDGVELVRFAYCDLAGVSRCKAIHVSQLAHKMVEGVSLSRAQLALNVVDDLVDIAGLTPVGEVRLRADPDTYVVLPERPATAMMWCDLVDHDRAPWAPCPRSLLTRVLAELGEAGITARASFEVEFYLGRDEGGRMRKLARQPVYSLAGHDASAPVLHDIVVALSGQGLEVEQAINEYGPGQQEVVVRHQPALQAADAYLTVKDTIRAVSARHGHVVSFAPKPFPDEIGSGTHLHLSLWNSDETANLLYDPDAVDALSAAGRSFVAGIRTHLPALLAVTAPSVNSYRRLAAGAWASSTNAWGFDNREAALRVASPFFGRESQTYNLEFKPIDGSANPYLALGAVLRSGLAGIHAGTALPPPAVADPARLGPAERHRLGIEDLPTDLGSALERFDADAELQAAFGPLLAAAFAAVRRSEAARFADTPVEDELFHLTYKY